MFSGEFILTFFVLITVVAFGTGFVSGIAYAMWLGMKYESRVPTNQYDAAKLAGEIAKKYFTQER